MQIETIDKYQLHLIAHELPAPRKWDPFFTILKFDDAIQDFTCVLEKHHVSNHPYDSYEAAIEAARSAATAWIEGRIHSLQPAAEKHNERARF